MGGDYTARFNESANLELVIDTKNNYSLQLLSREGQGTTSLLLSIGSASLVSDTVILTDKLNKEKIKLIFNQERDRLKTSKGFNMISARVFAKTETPVDDYYFSSFAVSTFDLPKTGNAAVIKKGIYYTSDEKFCLTLQPGGKYIYSYANLLISKGKWRQQKENIELWDLEQEVKFIVKQLSEKEMAVKSMYGIINYYDPQTAPAITTANHFYLHE